MNSPGSAEGKAAKKLCLGKDMVRYGHSEPARLRCDQTLHELEIARQSKTTSSKCFQAHMSLVFSKTTL